MQLIQRSLLWALDWFSVFRYASTKCSVMLKRHGHNKSFTPISFLPNTITWLHSFVPKSLQANISACDNPNVQLWIPWWDAYLIDFVRICIYCFFDHSLWHCGLVCTQNCLHSFSVCRILFCSLHKRLHFNTLIFGYGCIACTTIAVQRTI